MNNQPQSLKRKIGEGVAYFGTSDVFLQVFGFLTAVILLRKLSLTEYGLYQLVLASFGLIGSFTIRGVDSLIIADLSFERGRNRFDRVKNILFSYSKFKILSGIILWAVLFFGAGTIAERFFAKKIGDFLRIISFLFLLRPIKSIFTLVFNTHLKFEYTSFLKALEGLARLVLVYWFIVVLNYEVSGALYSLVLSLLIGLYVLFPFFIKTLGYLSSVPASKEKLFSQIFRKHGKWAAALAYTSDLSKNIRPWLVKIFVGIETVAIFSVARNFLAQVISPFPISGVLMPVIPTQTENKKRLGKIFSHTIKYSTLIFVFIAGAAFLLFPFLVKFLFPRYLSSLPIFNILLLTLLSTGFANVATSFFYALKAQKSFFFILVLKIILTVGLGSLALYLLGLPGIAIEFVLTAYFFNFARYLQLKKIIPECRLDLGEIFRLTKYDKALIKEILQKMKTKAFKFL